MNELNELNRVAEMDQVVGREALRERRLEVGRSPCVMAADGSVVLAVRPGRASARWENSAMLPGPLMDPSQLAAAKWGSEWGSQL